MLNKEDISDHFQKLQDDICRALEEADGGSTFYEDKWTRDAGGGGRSRVLSNGNVIEKGGVNFSAVYGPTPEKILNALQLPPSDFFATGVSIVLHPFNPWVPIIHMNVRYFEMSEGTWWFGGGIDLTPHYIDVEQASWFHQKLLEVCEKYDKAFYPKFKKWADDYFYLRHRRETRGVGGIFFDRLNDKSTAHSKSDLFDFVMEVGKSFAVIYTVLMQLNRDKPFDDQHKKWQNLRRGRYVEFNLVWDKGTKFGLDTDGRTEPILMSMPPLAGWIYDHQPNKDSDEAKTLSLLKKDINWLEIKL